MHSLFLLCEVPTWHPAPVGSVVRVLENAGLIGAMESGEDHRYQAGEQFLSLIMFLGCSPQISLTDAAATDGQPVCRIRLHEFKDVQLMESRPPPALRCPACRATFPRPSAPAYDRQQGCSACGESVPLYRLDWRRNAGFGRFFVEIENVFPHEAVPADRLTSVLEALSGNRWDYFYLSR